MAHHRSLLALYKLRLRRKRLLWRAFRARRQLTDCQDNTGSIKANDVLLFACMRNEAARLPYFLKHYRALGVRHFLIVDNASEDGTADLLVGQPDVSVWQSLTSYKASRFGMDWLTWLQRKFGHGHWCVTVDADELLVYPDCDMRDLTALTDWMAKHGQIMLGSMMLDLYPKGRLDDQTYVAGQDPREVLAWYDAFGYWVQKQPKMDNLWLQGGPRARRFFKDCPQHAPTLNKIPLVLWNRSFVYVNSTHNALPIKLNRTYESTNLEPVSGVLLHTKFLPDTAQRAAAEKARGEHFSNSADFDAYYDALTENPNLWTEESTRYTGIDTFIDLRLMERGGFS